MSSARENARKGENPHGICSAARRACLVCANLPSTVEGTAQGQGKRDAAREKGMGMSLDLVWGIDMAREYLAKAREAKTAGDTAKADEYLWCIGNWADAAYTGPTETPHGADFDAWEGYLDGIANHDSVKVRPDYVCPNCGKETLFPRHLCSNCTDAMLEAESADEQRKADVERDARGVADTLEGWAKAVRSGEMSNHVDTSYALERVGHMLNAVTYGNLDRATEKRLVDVCRDAIACVLVN